MYSQQFSFCEWQNRKKFFNLAKGSDARLDFESFQISSLAHTHTHTHRRDKKTAFGQCQETETNGTMAQRKSIVDSAKNSLLSKHKSRKLISMPLSREMFFLVREQSTRRRFPLVSVVVVLLLMCVCVTKVRIEHRIEQFSSSDSIQSVAETTWYLAKIVCFSSYSAVHLAAYVVQLRSAVHMPLLVLASLGLTWPTFFDWIQFSRLLWIHTLKQMRWAATGCSFNNRV